MGHQEFMADCAVLHTMPFCLFKHVHNGSPGFCAEYAWAILIFCLLKGRVHDVFMGPMIV